MTTIAHGYVNNNKLTGLKQEVLQNTWLLSVSSKFMPTQLPIIMKLSFEMVIQKSVQALLHQTKFLIFFLWIATF